MWGGPWSPSAPPEADKIYARHGGDKPRPQSARVKRYHYPDATLIQPVDRTFPRTVSEDGIQFKSQEAMNRAVSADGSESRP
jgi:hypothetical protein